MSSMSKEKFEEFRKIMYDSGGCDMFDVVDDYTPNDKKQRLKMRKKMLDFQKKYGSAHSHIFLSGRDYAQYCMIVNG